MSKSSVIADQNRPVAACSAGNQQIHISDDLAAFSQSGLGFAVKLPAKLINGSRHDAASKIGDACINLARMRLKFSTGDQLA